MPLRETSFGVFFEASVSALTYPAPLIDLATSGRRFGRVD